MKYLTVLLLFAGTAFATERYVLDQDQKQLQDQDQSQYQKTSQDVTVTTNEGATSMSADDNSFTSTSNVSSNIVMIPNNNTEGCLRVFGIGFPTSEGAVVLGIPWRSKTCDLKDASKDAFAQGNLMLGWMLKCKMKAMKKAFGSEQKCLDNVIEISSLTTEIDRLKGDLISLRNESTVQRARCEESNDRIFEACVAK